ncbi:MAG: hypothetical protein JW734_07810 [Candidatus Omnitrophica bacterium]|nr:hypothetical protein [Candidatus Omnitrophota bacterium]
MKNAIILILVVILAVLAWTNRFYLYEPAPAKVYHEYRKKKMAARGFSNEITESTRWSLRIKNCKVKDDIAEVLATEFTAKIPPNAASFVFATTTKSELKAELKLINKKWVVIKDSTLKKEVSTYEDRKNAAAKGN